MTGTINISRDLWDDTAFAAEKFSEREAWIWLISEASWKPRTRRIGKLVVETKRGQVAGSVRFFANAFGWSKSRFARFLGRLSERDMVSVESGTGINVITIRNYNKYQSQSKSDGTAAGQQRDSSGTAAGQQRDKREEGGKKGERRGKERTESPSEPSSSRDDQPQPSEPMPITDAAAKAIGLDVVQAFDAYNVTADRVGWPKVTKRTPGRRKALLSRIREVGGIEGFTDALAKAEASDFISGRGERSWAAFGFDALVKPANFTRLVEGNYDNRQPPTQHGNPNAPQPLNPNGGSNGRSTSRQNSGRRNADFDRAHDEYIRRLASGEINPGPDPSDPFSGR